MKPDETSLLPPLSYLLGYQEIRQGGANFSHGPAIPHIRLCIPFPFAEEVAAGELAELQLAGPGGPTPSLRFWVS